MKMYAKETSFERGQFLKRYLDSSSLVFYSLKTFQAGCFVIFFSLYLIYNMERVVGVIQMT